MQSECIQLEGEHQRNATLRYLHLTCTHLNDIPASGRFRSSVPDKIHGFAGVRWIKDA